MHITELYCRNTIQKYSNLVTQREKEEKKRENYSKVSD